MGWRDALHGLHGLRRAPASPAASPSVADLMAQAYEAAGAGDYEAALAIWGPLAHQGMARAQNNIGKCFGKSVISSKTKDPKQP